MAPHPLAGKPAPANLLIDVARLERDYYDRRPNLDDPSQLVSFGTSGHRGTPLDGTFTESHILAITQAICDYRRQKQIDGPLFMGKDTHAASGPAQRTALEVLAANGVETLIQRGDGFTPTPVISHAILVYNKGRTTHHGDGIVITIRRRTAVSSTIRPTADPPTPTSPTGCRTAPMRCSAPATRM
jgi:phosphoglucomutase